MARSNTEQDLSEDKAKLKTIVAELENNYSKGISRNRCDPQRQSVQPKPRIGSARRG